MKLRLLSILLLFTAGLTLTASMWIGANQRDEFLATRAELVIRQIGHDLLLHAGESSSLVMPIERTGPASFQLEFESRFSFCLTPLSPLFIEVLLTLFMQPAELVQHFSANNRLCNSRRPKPVQFFAAKMIAL